MLPCEFYLLAVSLPACFTEEAGLMLENVPGWIYVAGVAVVLVAGGIVPVLRGMGLHRFTAESWGDARDVKPTDPESLFAHYYEQLTALGFQPLGLYRESVLFHVAAMEYAFTHPEFHCRASIYELCGGDPRVCIKTDFEEGSLVRVFNYGDDELVSPNLVTRRVPTHSMARMMKEHDHARFRFLNEGLQPVHSETLAAWTKAEKNAFFHPAIQEEYRCCEIVTGASSIATATALALAVAGVVTATIRCDFAPVLLVCATAITAWRFLCHRKTLMLAMQELSDQQDHADAARRRSLSA